MPTERPKPGTCQTIVNDGLYCGNVPSPGSQRCKVHAGVSAAHLSGQLKESLYTRRLRESFKRPEDQRLFEEMSRTTNLDEEIRVARMRIVKYQEMLQNGEEWIYTDKAKHSGEVVGYRDDDGEPMLGPPMRVSENAQSVHDLLERAIDALRRLVQTQDTIHPGSEIGGNLRITIRVAGSTPPSEIPDLTDGEVPSRLPAAGDSTIDVVPVRNSGSGYNDE